MYNLGAGASSDMDVHLHQSSDVSTGKLMPSQHSRPSKAAVRAYPSLGANVATSTHPSSRTAEAFYQSSMPINGSASNPAYTPGSEYVHASSAIENAPVSALYLSHAPQQRAYLTSYDQQRQQLGAGLRPALAGYGVSTAVGFQSGAGPQSLPSPVPDAAPPLSSSESGSMPHNASSQPTPPRFFNSAAAAGAVAAGTWSAAVGGERLNPSPLNQQLLSVASQHAYQQRHSPGYDRLFLTEYSPATATATASVWSPESTSPSPLSPQYHHQQYQQQQQQFRMQYGNSTAQSRMSPQQPQQQYPSSQLSSGAAATVPSALPPAAPQYAPRYAASPATAPNPFATPVLAPSFHHQQHQQHQQQRLTDQRRGTTEFTPSTSDQHADTGGSVSTSAVAGGTSARATASAGHATAAASDPATNHRSRSGSRPHSRSRSGSHQRGSRATATGVQNIATATGSLHRAADVLVRRIETGEAGSDAVPGVIELQAAAAGMSVSVSEVKQRLFAHAAPDGVTGTRGRSPVSASPPAQRLTDAAAAYSSAAAPSTTRNGAQPPLPGAAAAAMNATTKGVAGSATDTQVDGAVNGTVQTRRMSVTDLHAAYIMQAAGATGSVAAIAGDIHRKRRHSLAEMTADAATAPATAATTATRGQAQHSSSSTIAAAAAQAPAPPLRAVAREFTNALPPPGLPASLMNNRFFQKAAAAGSAATMAGLVTTTAASANNKLDLGDGVRGGKNGSAGPRIYVTQQDFERIEAIKGAISRKEAVTAAAGPSTSPAAPSTAAAGAGAGYHSSSGTSGSRVYLTGYVPLSELQRMQTGHEQRNQGGLGVQQQQPAINALQEAATVALSRSTSHARKSSPESLSRRSAAASSRDRSPPKSAVLKSLSVVPFPASSDVKQLVSASSTDSNVISIGPSRKVPVYLTDYREMMMMADGAAAAAVSTAAGDKASQQPRGRPRSRSRSSSPTLSSKAKHVPKFNAEQAGTPGRQPYGPIVARVACDGRGSRSRTRAADSAGVGQFHTGRRHASRSHSRPRSASPPAAPAVPVASSVSLSWPPSRSSQHTNRVASIANQAKGLGPGAFDDADIVDGDDGDDDAEGSIMTEIDAELRASKRRGLLVGAVASHSAAAAAAHSVPALPLPLLPAKAATAIVRPKAAAARAPSRQRSASVKRASSATTATGSNTAVVVRGMAQGSGSAPTSSADGLAEHSSADATPVASEPTAANQSPPMDAPQPLDRMAAAIEAHKRYRLFEMRALKGGTWASAVTIERATAPSSGRSTPAPGGTTASSSSSAVAALNQVPSLQVPVLSSSGRLIGASLAASSTMGDDQITATEQPAPVAATGWTAFAAALNKGVSEATIASLRRASGSSSATSGSAKSSVLPGGQRHGSGTDAAAGNRKTPNPFDTPDVAALKQQHRGRTGRRSSDDGDDDGDESGQPTSVTAAAASSMASALVAAVMGKGVPKPPSLSYSSRPSNAQAPAGVHEGDVVDDDDTMVGAAASRRSSRSTSPRRGNVISAFNNTTNGVRAGVSPRRTVSARNGNSASSAVAADDQPPVLRTMSGRPDAVMTNRSILAETIGSHILTMRQASSSDAVANPEAGAAAAAAHNDAEDDGFRFPTERAAIAHEKASARTNNSSTRRSASEPKQSPRGGGLPTSRGTADAAAQDTAAAVAASARNEEEDEVRRRLSQSFHSGDNYIYTAYRRHSESAPHAPTAIAADVAAAVPGYQSFLRRQQAGRNLRADQEAAYLIVFATGSKWQHVTTQIREFELRTMKRMSSRESHVHHDVAHQNIDSAREDAIARQRRLRRASSASTSVRTVSTLGTARTRSSSITSRRHSSISGRGISRASAVLSRASHGVQVDRGSTTSQEHQGRDFAAATRHDNDNGQPATAVFNFTSATSANTTIAPMRAAVAIRIGERPADYIGAGGAAASADVDADDEIGGVWDGADRTTSSHQPIQSSTSAASTLPSAVTAYTESARRHIESPRDVVGTGANAGDASTARASQIWAHGLRSADVDGGGTDQVHRIAGALGTAVPDVTITAGNPSPRRRTSDSFSPRNVSPRRSPRTASNGVDSAEADARNNGGSSNNGSAGRRPSYHINPARISWGVAAGLEPLPEQQTEEEGEEADAGGAADGADGAVDAIDQQGWRLGSAAAASGVSGGSGGGAHMIRTPRDLDLMRFTGLASLPPALSAASSSSSAASPAGSLSATLAGYTAAAAPAPASAPPGSSSSSSSASYAQAPPSSNSAHSHTGQHLLHATNGNVFTGGNNSGINGDNTAAAVASGPPQLASSAPPMLQHARARNVNLDDNHSGVNNQWRDYAALATEDSSIGLQQQEGMSMHAAHEREQSPASSLGDENEYIQQQQQQLEQQQHQYDRLRSYQLSPGEVDFTHGALPGAPVLQVPSVALPSMSSSAAHGEDSSGSPVHGLDGGVAMGRQDYAHVGVDGLSARPIFIPALPILPLPLPPSSTSASSSSPALIPPTSAPVKHTPPRRKAAVISATLDGRDSRDSAYNGDDGAADAAGAGAALCGDGNGDEIEVGTASMSARDTARSAFDTPAHYASTPLYNSGGYDGAEITDAYSPEQRNNDPFALLSKLRYSTGVQIETPGRSSSKPSPASGRRINSASSSGRAPANGRVDAAAAAAVHAPSAARLFSSPLRDMYGSP